MKWLINIIARLISSRIEQGSIAVAAICAAVLGGLGALLTYAMNVHSAVEPRWGPESLTIGIPLALLGAIIGSALGPQRAIAPPNSDRVRIGNWNAALGPMVAAMLVTALGVVGLVAPGKDMSDSLLANPAFYMTAVGSVVVVILSYVSVVWVEFSAGFIVIGRIWRKRTIATSSIVDWSFQIGDAEPTRAAPRTTSVLLLLLQGRGQLRVNVSPRDAALIAGLLRQA